MKKLANRGILAFATALGICGSAFSATPLPVVNATAAPTQVTHPDWSHQAVIYEVNTRQITPEGTFDAFATHLPRLKNLGVDILWFMPIHPISEVNRKGTLGSYYAVRDYKGVNPEFGSHASFKALVDKAHANGMKVIIDWVPNHTGCDNDWVKTHPDWFQRNEKGEMFGPFDWTDVYQLDYTNPEMRKGMIDAMSFWLTDIGIDGFRCDVAGRVPADFWAECRKELEKKTGKGNLFMLAEAVEPELVAEGFDMDYNWPMKDMQNRVADARGEYIYTRPGSNEPHHLQPANAIDLAKLVAEQATTYPTGSYMMNMITNHDLNSWEGTEYERYGKLLPAMTVLTYALPGMPLIYTGQEVGLDRALEFFEKDQIPEFKSLAQVGSRGSRLTAMYSALNAMKHKYPQLGAGIQNVEFLPVADANNQLAIRRQLPGKPAVVAVMNFGKTPMDIKGFRKGATEELMVGAEGLIPANSTLAPGQAIILVK